MGATRQGKRRLVFDTTTKNFLIPPRPETPEEMSKTDMMEFEVKFGVPSMFPAKVEISQKEKVRARHSPPMPSISRRLTPRKCQSLSFRVEHPTKLNDLPIINDQEYATPTPNLGASPSGTPCLSAQTRNLAKCPPIE
jgi:hypothetical protein